MAKGNQDAGQLLASLTGIQSTPGAQSVESAAGQVAQTMSRPVLRFASPADADFIYLVYERSARSLVESTGKRWAGARMLEKARAEAADSATHIIQCDGEDCGVFRLETRSSELWLDALFLLPERQRRGLGTELLAGVHAMSEELRLPTRLQVMSYSPARQYYERFGYAVTHEEGDILDMERLP